MSIQSDEFYESFALALIAEIGNVNARVKMANKLADIFQQHDTPEVFNRAVWIERVRAG